MRKFLVLTILSFSTFILADFRRYTFTYEAVLQPKGQLEIENYFTYKVPAKPVDKNLIEEWLELEYGISDYFDIALYQTFKQKTGESFKYDGFKTRVRFRPWLPSEKFLDFVFYFEPQLRGDSFDEQKLETKLIFTKPLGKFSISKNLIHEWAHKRGTKETINEYKLQLAARYEFQPSLSIGAEFETKFIDTRDGKSPTYFLGPAIAYGKGQWWVNAGIRFGLNNITDDVQFRTIFGLEF